MKNLKNQNLFIKNNRKSLSDTGINEMKWNDAIISKPDSHWKICLVTDGTLIALAFFVDDIREYYGDDYLDDDGEPIDQDLLKDNCCWEFIPEAGLFHESQNCFGNIGEISHWMYIPNAPKQST